MERADINSVLMQMRSIKSQVQGAGESFGIPNAINNGDTQPVGRTNFGEILKSAVDSVNEAQGEAKKLTVAYEQGDPAVDLPQVMIAAERASVSFEAITQVRNRLVSAYEDIMQMPI